ncbi:redoxin domain-containing protein [Candidatus Bipolaricaulota bacterium]|nr:redoxin domain-containing protein [Candidatus Bipolaricaulota bacterium]
MRTGEVLRRFGAVAAAVALMAAALGGCLSRNAAPIASFTRTPSAGDAPLSVFFDASASVDPEGGALTHRWAFGDGETASGETATHTYETAGTYETVLTAIDAKGAEGTSARMVTVNDAAVIEESGSAVGQQAIDFTLNDLDGIPLTLSEYRGYVILLDFWSSTCTPCKLTMPHLELLRARFAGDGLVVIGVSVDTSEQAARAFIESNGYTEFIILYGSEAEARAVKSQYGVVGIPHTFVIDRQGIIRHHDHPIRLRDWHIEPWL